MLSGVVRLALLSLRRQLSYRGQHQRLGGIAIAYLGTSRYRAGGLNLKVGVRGREDGQVDGMATEVQ